MSIQLARTRPAVVTLAISSVPTPMQPNVASSEVPKNARGYLVTSTSSFPTQSSEASGFLAVVEDAEGRHLGVECAAIVAAREIFHLRADCRDASRAGRMGENGGVFQRGLAAFPAIERRVFVK